MKKFHIYESGELIKNRYKVKKRCEGGMAYVYIADDKEVNITYAIKTPKLKEIDAPFTDIIIDDFKHESEMWLNLYFHPNIVGARLFEFDEYGQPLLFLEYVDGLDLHALIHEKEKDKRLSVIQCLDFSIQICEGMKYIFSTGVISAHRDLKPKNVMVTKKRVAKVCDMGLARKEYGKFEVRRTPGPMVMCTYIYASLEQLKDSRECDEISDIYSFGVTLYEILNGELPYQITPEDLQETNYLSCIRKIVSEKEPLPMKNKLVPESFKKIVFKCMTKEASGRYKNFQEILDELKEVEKELKQDRSFLKKERREKICEQCGYINHNTFNECCLCGNKLKFGAVAVPISLKELEVQVDKTIKDAWEIFELKGFASAVGKLKLMLYEIERVEVDTGIKKFFVLIMHNIAMIYARVKHVSAAQREWKNVRLLDPHFYEADLEEGKMLVSLSRHEESVALFKKVLENSIEPELFWKAVGELLNIYLFLKPDLHKCKELVFHKLNKYVQNLKAVEGQSVKFAFERILLGIGEGFPNREVQNFIIDFYEKWIEPNIIGKEKEIWKEIGEELKRAFEFFGRWSALLLLRQSRPSKYIEIGEFCLKILGENAMIYLYLGEAYESLGERSKAKECYNKALKLGLASKSIITKINRL